MDRAAEAVVESQQAIAVTELQEPADLDLPTESEFWEAVSDCSNVVISAAGRHISANSTLLEQQSPVFSAQLAALLNGMDSALYEKDGKVRLDLDCSFAAAQALSSFITTQGASTADHLKSSAPATLRELALLGQEWQVSQLLEMVDHGLAVEMQKDIQHFAKSSAHTWQYSGSHIRERGVQMLQLSHKAGLGRLQAEAEHFVAANWQHLKMDPRLTQDLEAESLCRIHHMAGWMCPRPVRPTPVSHCRMSAPKTRRRAACRANR